MSQIQISAEVALREAMIKNQWLENRVLVLAQQLADAEKRAAPAHAPPAESAPTT